MRFNSFETDNNLFEPLSFPSDKRVILLCGQSSDTLLDLMRALIGDAGDKKATNSCGAAYADIGVGDISYDVCCVLNADGCGKHSVGVGYEPGNSSDALTRNAEYARILSHLSSERGNVFSASKTKCDPSELLSESDRVLAAFDRFASSVRRDTESGDERPVFVYGLFDRIDEAENRRRIANSLLSIGRQVFVSVSSSSAVGELLYDSPDGCYTVTI